MLMGVHPPKKKQAVRYFARIDDALKGPLQFNLGTLIGKYVSWQNCETIQYSQ